MLKRTHEPCAGTPNRGRSYGMRLWGEAVPDARPRCRARFVCVSCGREWAEDVTEEPQILAWEAAWRAWRAQHSEGVQQ